MLAAFVSLILAFDSIVVLCHLWSYLSIVVICHFVPDYIPVARTGTI